MEFKGTKGKWKVGKRNNCIISDDETSLTIKGTTGLSTIRYYGGNLICESVSKENALLISKAPEMLEMLINVKDYLGSEVRVKVEQLIKEAIEL